MHPVSMSSPALTMPPATTQASSPVAQTTQPAANAPSPVAGDRFQMPSPTSVAGADPFESLNQVHRQLVDFIHNARSPGAKEMGQALELQMNVQQAGMTVELMSKTVEHATSGTKTILQTQA